MNAIILIIVVCVSLIAQIYIYSNYAKYRKKKIKKEETGFEIARSILDKHELNNIYITEVKGSLTDHYFYSRKVVRLSKNIFHGKSIMSTALASFLSAHALMDNEHHKLYRCRMVIEPFINFITFVGIILIFVGLFFASKNVFMIGSIFELIYLLFQIISLPIEFEASRRALDELLEQSLINRKETDDIKKVLLSLCFLNVGSIYRSIKEAFLALYYFGKGD